MQEMQCLAELRSQGRMRWTGAGRAWVASPGDVIDALGREGFEEYRRDEARVGSRREPPGGVWQGLDRRTGAVASAIWVRGTAPRAALVFIDIDGQAFEAAPA